MKARKRSKDSAPEHQCARAPVKITGALVAGALVLFFCAHVVTPALAINRLPRGEWNNYKSTHFIIYYHPSIEKSYIKEFTKKCEHYYGVITERLGFNRFNFWLWDDRALVFIYKDKEQYVEQTGRAGWSGASVHIKKKHISTFYFAQDFFDVILPHEMGHIILREFIGLKAKAPLWFDEGVACANEEDCLLRYLVVAKGLMESGIGMKLSEMEMIKPGEIIFPSVFYSTSASIVIFLLEEFKGESFVAFCKELRDGTSFYEAMDKIYAIGSCDELEKRLKRFLKQKNYLDIVSVTNFSVDW